MTPTLESPLHVRAAVSEESRSAAEVVRDAADRLSRETQCPREASRFRRAADRLASAIESPRTGRQRLLLASPAVIERSGRTRTLIEIIEAEPAEKMAQLRLAMLLLRALDWKPETFPYPAQ